MNAAVDLFVNPRVRPPGEYPRELLAVLAPERADRARTEIATWPGYAGTPLVDLPGMATRLGVARILYKDEGPRFGLDSFKSLGGAYAVYLRVAREVESCAGVHPSSRALEAGEHAEIAAAVTVCSATDGNHGRSVAWGARRFGCRCVIYVHATVSVARERAIAAFGAEVIRVDGNYDETVRRADADAKKNGWTVISDTSYPGYEEIPKDVMHGYTVMAAEVVESLADEAPPTHVFLQGGVGGLAAAVCACQWWAYGAQRPAVILVEPDRAACLLASARAGGPVALTGDIETVMAGLSCGEPSLEAWKVLDAGTHAFMCIPDDDAVAMMRTLAEPISGDPPVVAGESAVAGLAGFARAVEDPRMAADIGLDADSRVLVFGSEGATDPELYRELVGRDPAAVAGA